MKLFLTHLLAMALLWAVAIQTIQAEETSTPRLEPQQVRDAIRLVLQREATAKSPDARAAAIRDLSKMYVAIVRDEEMAMAARKRYQAKMYSRLMSIKKDLKDNISRHKRNPKAELPQYPTSESLLEAAQTARGGGAVRDYGETLVELIQATVSPEHWDVNGGPGSIVYYPNLKVLVVRASGEAHGRVGGLFDGLRRVP